jgi:branched-chain amino acid transport system ATP-binding protein
VNATADPTGALAPIAEVTRVVKRYGGVAAIDGVDLTVPRHRSLAVIGPNGAGKSTLLKLIAGEVRPDEGRVCIDGTPHRGGRPELIARRGVGLAHQVPVPFGRLTVRENVRVGALHRRRLRLGAPDLVDEILDRCELSHLADRPAASLGLLNLKRLELARALSLEPALLLLDEVAGGLAGKDLRTIIELVSRIRDQGVTLVLVEHVEGVVRELVERVVVLDWGKVIAEGTPAAIAEDERVREIYLGTGSGAAGPAASPRSRRRAPGEPTGAALALRSVTAGYGAIVALREVVLGANGAGKTTLARTVSGLTPVAAGALELDGRDVSRLPVHDRARLGIAHCQEGRRLFPGLSVEENLVLAARSAEARAHRAERRKWVHALFPVLAERSRQAAETLSGGQQQMLAIGRALMSHPRLVIFDEISLGLAPVAIDSLYDAIAEVAESGISIILVEQNVHRSLALADRAYVLDRGRVSFAGDPQELLDAGRLEAAYFGTGTASGSQGAAAPDPLSIT